MLRDTKIEYEVYGQMENLWGEIKAIYDKLQDEESKYIFRRRMSYCLCHNDIEPIYEMVTHRDENTERGFYDLIKNREKYKDKEIVLFGAGFYGKLHRKVFEQYKISGIVAYCDNNPELWGKQVCNTLVMPVDEAVDKYPNAIYIIESANFWKEMRTQLLKSGVDEKNIISIFVSSELFGRQYFDTEIIKPIKDGVFIDGGCFDLSDTLEFIMLNPNFKRVYAFEPDKKNYAQCLAKIPCKQKNKIVIENKGLWHENKQLSFNSNSSSSMITENGGDRIDVVSLDEYLDYDEKITFIKMDIEGAELKALQGAKQLISRDKPDLAICIYHRDEDIVNIPRYILELNPHYKLYIRHYSCYVQETVLYAVSDK